MVVSLRTTFKMIGMLAAVLRIRIQDPVLFYPLDRGSGMNFSGSRILDPGSFWLWNIRSNKKVSLHSTFQVGSGIRDEKMFGSGSGMRKWSDPDTGCFIPDPQHWWAAFGRILIEVWQVCLACSTARKIRSWSDACASRGCRNIWKKKKLNIISSGRVCASKLIYWMAKRH
jgi:hypothetical protein